MILKILRALWFLSVLSVLANLLYVYAGLPEEVVIYEEGEGQALIAGRELLFYIATTFIVLSNVFVYAIKSLFVKNEDFRTWAHGLLITVNLFVIVSMSFIGIYNSYENYDLNNAGYILYGSLVLVVLCALGWPAYLVLRKFLFKPAV